MDVCCGTCVCSCALDPTRVASHCHSATGSIQRSVPYRSCPPRTDDPGQRVAAAVIDGHVERCSSREAGAPVARLTAVWRGGERTTATVLALIGRRIRGGRSCRGVERTRSLPEARRRAGRQRRGSDDGGPTRLPPPRRWRSSVWTLITARSGQSQCPNGCAEYSADVTTPARPPRPLDRLPAARGGVEERPIRPQRREPGQVRDGPCPGTTASGSSASIVSSARSQPSSGPTHITGVEPTNATSAANTTRASGTCTIRSPCVCAGPTSIARPPPPTSRSSRPENVRVGRVSEMPRCSYGATMPPKEAAARANRQHEPGTGSGSVPHAAAQTRSAAARPSSPASPPASRAPPPRPSQQSPGHRPTRSQTSDRRHRACSPACESAPSPPAGASRRASAS